MIMRSAPRSCRMATSARRSCALFPRGFPFPREQIPWRPPGRQARRASSPIDLSDALWHDRRARALHGRSPARLRRYRAPAVPPREGRWTARRSVVRGQGPLRRGRLPDGRRQPRLGAHPPGSHRDGARRAPAARCRRDPRRQVVHRRAGLQPRRHQHPLRHAPQSALPRPPARRLVQWIGLRRRRGTRRLRPRHRHERLHPRPRELLRRVRLSPHPRRRAHRRCGAARAQQLLALAESLES